ncbi:hypothetical protein P7K49_025667 [Saguinus oedipus]|uniref:Uncharacterized protein n=1 Tax=Saguinus oedipus TaxID=9490 RepID=A0ABQ9UHT2_SAGOE|nr:hypothetical protein P7K49_025667 [Saguinus oedipus]
MRCYCSLPAASGTPRADVKRQRTEGPPPFLRSALHQEHSGVRPPLGTWNWPQPGEFPACREGTGSPEKESRGRREGSAQASLKTKAMVTPGSRAQLVLRSRIKLIGGSKPIPHPCLQVTTSNSKMHPLLWTEEPVTNGRLVLPLEFF